MSLLATTPVGLCHVTKWLLAMLLFSTPELVKPQAGIGVRTPQTSESDALLQLGAAFDLLIPRSDADLPYAGVGWSGDNFCAWNGVLCVCSSTSCHIVELDLGANSLIGSSAALNPLSALVSLRRLNLSTNAISGPLLNSWSNMWQLEVLDLSRNQLTGRVPAWIGGLPVLYLADLSSNQLKGPIPPAVCEVEGVIRLAGNTHIKVSKECLTLGASVSNEGDGRASTAALVGGLVGAILGALLLGFVLSLIIMQGRLATQRRERMKLQGRLATSQRRERMKLQESEGEEAEASRVTLAQDMGKGNVAARQSRVRLYEIGPRMELEIVKVEEGMCDGKVLYHAHVKRSATEIKAQQAQKDERERLRGERRQDQEGNVKKKKMDLARKEAVKAAGKMREAGKLPEKKQWWELELAEDSKRSRETDEVGQAPGADEKIGMRDPKYGRERGGARFGSGVARWGPPVKDTDEYVPRFKREKKESSEGGGDDGGGDGDGAGDGAGGRGRGRSSGRGRGQGQEGGGRGRNGGGRGRDGGGRGRDGGGRGGDGGGRSRGGGGRSRGRG
eukprot:gene30067-35036_t